MRKLEENLRMTAVLPRWTFGCFFLSPWRNEVEGSGGYQFADSGEKILAGLHTLSDCSLHCRLAKFRGLMIGGKYGDVIGRETRFFVCAQLQWGF
jgi:hypothetical protein